MHDNGLELKNALYNVQKILSLFLKEDDQSVLAAKSQILFSELKQATNNALDDRHELQDTLQQLLDSMYDDQTVYNEREGDYYEYVKDAARVLEQAGGTSPFPFDEEDEEELGE